MSSAWPGSRSAEPGGVPVTARSPHVEVLFLARPSDNWSRKQGRLAYVRCTLDGAAMKPLIVVRHPDRSLGVKAFDWVELPSGEVVPVGDRFRGVHLDDPRLGTDMVGHIRDAVLERAQAEGLQ